MSSLPVTFSSFDQARGTSEVLCCACLWSLKGKPPNTLRMWSILYREEGSWTTTSHPDAPDFGTPFLLTDSRQWVEVLRILQNPPSGRWAMGLTTNRKVHIAPFVRIRTGSRLCEALVDRVRTSWSPLEVQELIEHMVPLLKAGALRRDIAFGTPSSTSLSRVGKPLWHHFRALEPWRQSPLLALIERCLSKEVLSVIE